MIGATGATGLQGLPATGASLFSSLAAFRFNGAPDNEILELLSGDSLPWDTAEIIIGNAGLILPDKKGIRLGTADIYKLSFNLYPELIRDYPVLEIVCSGSLVSGGAFTLPYVMPVLIQIWGYASGTFSQQFIIPAADLKGADTISFRLRDGSLVWGQNSATGNKGWHSLIIEGYKL